MAPPQILAHRGASAEAPENSLAAFRRAAEVGADGIELDIHATRDGALVVHHDLMVAGVGPIPDNTLSTIRQARLPNGEPIPTLEEALDAAGSCEVWIELKTLPPSADVTLLKLLAGAPDQYAVHSFDHRLVARLGAARPDLRRGCLLTARVLDPVHILDTAGATVLWQEWAQIDRELVETVHGASCQIIAWTVNDLPAADRLRAWGVDGVCGNDPLALRDWVAGRQRQSR